MNTKSDIYYCYDVKDSYEVVYRGITNDPKNCEKQHKEQGWQFTHINMSSKRLTYEEARKIETIQLRKYRLGHHGKSPRYNKAPDPED
ncbi:MAG: hypothetical protein GDA50_03500 [Alphaproteobacteria bacterium GM202ARS2]|nr:hypothetical protein [Alphaproteobacteria bacterium GM202ARS2]